MLTPRTVTFTLVLASLCCGYAAIHAEPMPTVQVFRLGTMGTEATLNLVATDSMAAAPAARAAGLALDRIDSLMSNWTTTSEVARINREAGDGWTTIHPQVSTVLNEALTVGRESDGAFDVTVEPLVRLWGFLGEKSLRVPELHDLEEARSRVGLSGIEYDAARNVMRFVEPDVQIDLGGIAKGYGVDAAAYALTQAGVTAALVDLSGNMAAIGHPPWRETWNIGIRDPRNRVKSLGSIEVVDRAIATSGVYEQFLTEDGRSFGHILDPRTGWPVDGFLSVTVVAPTATLADAWGTAFFVLGPQAAHALAVEREDLDVIFVESTAAGDLLWVESSLRPVFSLSKEALGLVAVRYF